MVRVRFISADGTRTDEFDAPTGASLLEVAQDNGQPLEGTCEGQMSCSTCHVIIAADDFARLPKAIEDEEDMLDFAACTSRNSRLSCQITLTEALDGLTVHIPPESRNMQGR
ncbi:MAG: 2Fe-2S iron-sulfur cluster-binding protein [Pseudomonadota bacterium]